MAKKVLDIDGLLYFWQKIKTTFVSVADYVATDNNYTNADKSKLDGIASGAEVNVQSDWNEADSSSDAFIKNKPTIPSGVTVDSALSDSSENPVQNKVINSALGGKVPATRKVNNKALSADITLSASDVSAIAASEKGSANGVCPLDANGKVASANLPSYVDDVVEAYPRTGQTELSAAWLSATSGGAALTPEKDKIYILMADSTTYSTNSTFRWSGSTYVLLGDGNVSAITNAEIDTILAS